MKIQTLRVKNLGPFKEMTVEFDRPVAILLGDNATGKTTLASAIEVLLTGRASRFAGHRIGLAALIGPHEDTAEIAAHLIPVPNGRAITLIRRIGPKGLTTEVGGHQTTKEAFDFISPPTMRNPERAWRAVCHVGGVLDRDPADQQAVLLDLVDPGLPDEALAGLRFDLLGGGRPTTLDRIESAYQEAYRKRRAAKARLAELAVTEPERPRANLDAITARLTELRGQAGSAMRSSGESLGRRQALEQERGQVATVLSRLQGELDGLGSEASAQQAVTEAEKAMAVAQEARKDHEQVDREVTNTAARVAGIAALEATLAKQGAECETCGTKLTADTRRARAEALKTERLKLETWLKRHPLPVVADDHATAERAFAEAKHRLIRLGERQLEVQRRTKELDALDAKIARMSPAETETASEAAYRELVARIEKGERLLAEATALNRAWDQYEESQRRWQQCSEEVVGLEALCEALGPKGLGPTILRDRFGAVLGKLNRLLGRFALEMSIQDEPWALRFNGRPTLLLSGSERWRCGVCLQLAVGALTGARLVIVDGADVLDPANRAVFLGVAAEAVEKGLTEQIIVTATLHDPVAELRGWKTPVRAYHLRGGEIEPLQ